MTNAAKYYIWLTIALGYNTPKLKALCELYPDIAAFYEAGEMEWRLSGVLRGRDIEAMLSTPLSDALSVIADCNRLGYTVISFGDPDYPRRLYEIYAPPAVLYVWGRLPDPDRLTLSMVGTRSATRYGKQVAYSIAASIASLGGVVVSGGAVGIDSMAHTGAVEAGGKSICVLGCGLHYRYLMQNFELRRSVASSGAVVSEYPPDFPSGKFTFPNRNRIISGLSDGVIVVEAGSKSGSLITASCALEQDRDVFAVMGNITSPYSEGTNRLIKDGAIPVTDISDILQCYPQYRVSNAATSLVEPVPEHREDLDVSDDAMAVYRVITAEAIHIDTVTSLCGMPVSRVLCALTELELCGAVAGEPGRMYKLL